MTQTIYTPAKALSYNLTSLYKKFPLENLRQQEFKNLFAKHLGYPDFGLLSDRIQNHSEERLKNVYDILKFVPWVSATLDEDQQSIQEQLDFTYFSELTTPEFYFAVVEGGETAKVYGEFHLANYLRPFFEAQKVELPLSLSIHCLLGVPRAYVVNAIEAKLNEPMNPIDLLFPVEGGNLFSGSTRPMIGCFNQQKPSVVNQAADPAQLLVSLLESIHSDEDMNWPEALRPLFVYAYHSKRFVFGCFYPQDIQIQY